MSDRQRQRAFVLSAVFTVVVCALVYLIERPRSEEPERAERSEPLRPVVLSTETPGPSARRPSAREPKEDQPSATSRQGGPPPPQPPSATARQDDPPPPDQGVPGEAAIVSVARRFTYSYIEYQVGRIPENVMWAIKLTTTRSLGTDLLSEPPRIPRGVRPPRPARVRLISLANGPIHEEAAVVAELEAASGKVSTLIETLSRSGREWRISGLG